MKRNRFLKNSIKMILLIMFISIMTLCLFRNNLRISAYSNSETLLSTEKIYANINIEDNFDDSSVIVIIDRINSGINKSHENTIFKDIEFSEIIDLTYVNNVATITDINNFEQILKIKLIESGKQKVIDMINRLSLVEGIKYVGPNRIFEIDRTPNDPLYTPNTSVNGQWCHNTIQSENAWNFLTGSSNVRIGVIDTGISNHTDLRDNLVQGLDFFNMVDGEPGVARTDEDGHGTHVAGIIGAVGNQATATGVVGVNWDVTIVPMQVSNNSGGISSDACVSAINYARDIWDTPERISVLSMSIGSYQEWPEMESAIREYQGLFVCSTGNSELNNDGIKHHYPSFYGSDMHTNPLPNLISVGRSDINDARPTNANWGNRTIMLFSPGHNILSTYPEEFCTGILRNTRWGSYLNCECIWSNEYNDFGIFEWVPNGTTHHSNGYHYSSGSSMATPQVSGVAALLLSINPNLTTQQLRTAILESVDIPNVNGSNPLEGLCVTDGRLNAYNAIKYVLENYINPTTYTLSNYSSTINTNKTIASDASYFNELNGFYKLNVTYAKNYEFISSSVSGIDVTLYDEDFTEITFNDLDSTTNKVHFIESLSTGTYYLRVKYVNEESTGTINTKIVSRNTTYLNAGENDILINSYNNISSYVYGNSTGKGFYKITLAANTSSGVITYPESCIKVYKDSTKQELVTRLETIYYTLPANTSSSSNNLIVFLDQGSTYYIDIIIPNDIYSIVSLDIEKIEDTYEINMFNNIEEVYEEEVLLEEDETQFGDYIQKIEIKQKGIYSISFIHEGPQSEASSNFLYYALYKELVGPPEEIGNVEMLLPQMTTTMGGTITYEFTLDKGIYYIGYYNKLNYEPMSITIKYQIDVYDSNKIITDPDLLTDCGSMINIYEKNLGNKSYRGKTIVVGFTRILYLDPILEIDTRTDYSWYSSNEDIATVSEFGTVFAKSPGTVKIMAVNKEDLKIVYIETFTVINDNSTDTTERIININDTHSVSDGDYLVGLTALNSPYPSAYLYDWEILSYDETITRIEYIGSGYFVIEGFGDVLIKGSNYAYNNKYSIKIYLNVTQ